MNYEQHDNLILADWTLQGSPLSRAADAELTIFEELVDKVRKLTANNRIEAVIWLQKVPVHDFHLSWLEELKTDLLRDELRWRLRRWYRLRQYIQYSTLPWFYVTESNCQGIFFEMMMVCHRRFVFRQDTLFGFPELVIGSLPPIGWFAGQILKRPKLLEALQKRPLMQAGEAVQLGLIDAALNWKDWRLNLLPWARRQVEAWQLEHSARPVSALVQEQPLHMWIDKALRDQAKSPISLFLNAPRLKETPVSTDFQLLDTAAHFYCQAPYETWIRRGLQQTTAWGDPPRYELIFFDVNEALPPLSIVARLLDNGQRLCFVATEAEVLRQGLEALFTQLDARYRRSIQQQFERQLAWYVGETPREPQYPTLAFGAFRNFQFNLRELRIRGWALAAQSMERQVAEIDQEQASRATLLRIFFDGIHCVASPQRPRPALYYVKSLALQAMVGFAEQSGETMPEILAQLRGIGWNLLGSERHWQRFLEYRSGIQSRVPIEELEHLGSLDFQPRVFRAPHWRAICELATPRSQMELIRHGPGYLQNYLAGFSRLLSQALYEKSCVPSEDLADLYVADALGFPDLWGTSGIFNERMGVPRPFFGGGESPSRPVR